MRGNAQLCDMETRTCEQVSSQLFLGAQPILNLPFPYPHRCLCRNVAEQLIEKGLASIVHHRRDDEDRSPDYDKLMAAEQAYAIPVISSLQSDLNIQYRIIVLLLNSVESTQVKNIQHPSNHSTSQR